MNTKTEIQKIPFNGKGKNLIDFFCIIGYEEHSIEEIIAYNSLKQQLSCDLAVISFICSEGANTVFDKNKLIKIIYPTIPEITDNTQVKDKTSNVIFAFPMSNVKGTSQNLVCGYFKLFYEPYYNNHLKRTIYLPKAFAIISQFPYFTTFHTICNNILLYFQNTQIANKYPIELLLYIIINYTPSPLNSELILDLFPNKYINEFQSSLRIPQLSGYPVMDFNISKLFNLFPIYFIIEVFIFTLLEVDMFFFSDNLEILNIVMYIFYALNYPLNDSINFWHIFSLSKKDLSEKAKPQFINAILSKCIIFQGVNCKYEESIEIPKQFSNYSIIDLDSKKIIHKGEIKNVDKRDQIGKYIQKCIKGKASSRFMQNIILRLVNNINSINIDQSRMSLAFGIQKQSNFYEFNNEINENNRTIQQSFYEVIICLLNKFYNDHKISFDINENSTSIINDYKTTENKTKNDISNNNNDHKNKYDLFKLDYASDDNALCDKAELLIIDLFKTSTKFDNYFKNYLYDFNSQDNYLIPLMFSEEFINLNLLSSTIGNNNYDNADTNSYNKLYFDVIDNFYYNTNDNFTTLNMNQHKISFDSFFKAVKAEVLYKSINIDLEPKIDTKKSFRTSMNMLLNQKEVPTYSFFKYIKLDKKALLRTIAYCNNIEENTKYKLIPQEKLKSLNAISESLSLRIVHSLEEAMISLNLVDVDDILLSSMFFLFLVTHLEISFYDSIIFFNHLTFQLVSHQYFIRKYIHYFLLSLHSFITSDEFNETKLNSNTNMIIIQRIKLFYTLIISISNNNQIFPNEELTQLMLSLKNNHHIKTPSLTTIEEPIPNSKEDNIDFSIEIIDKDNKEINSKTILDVIKSTLCSCNIEIYKTDQFSQRDEVKINFKLNRIIDNGNISLQQNQNVKQNNKMTPLYSPVKLKEKCEAMCNECIKSGSKYKEVIDKVINFDIILINTIYYSTISSDLKFFTEYLIKVYLLYSN